jgi:hypothetical protein
LSTNDTVDNDTPNILASSTAVTGLTGCSAPLCFGFGIRRQIAKSASRRQDPIHAAMKLFA